MAEPIDAARRAEALELARKHGAAEASRQTGVAAGTIRVWLSRASKAESAESPTPTDLEPEQDDGDASVTHAQATLEAARRAVTATLARLEETVPSGRGGPQALAITAGVLIDKAAQLEAQIATARERVEARVSEENARFAMVLVDEYFAAVEVPMQRDLWMALLEAANAGQFDPATRCWMVQRPQEFLDTVAAAKEATEKRMRDLFEYRDKQAVTQAAQRAKAPEAQDPARRALPAPPEPESEVETVSGEVVDEPPRRGVHNPRGGWGRYMGGRW